MKDVFYLDRVYRKTPLLHRLHVLIRRVTCPFDMLVGLVPDEGMHADVGCGHGVFLALRHRNSRFGLNTGIDIDPRKITQALKADLPGIDFRCGSLEEFSPETFDSVSLVDVLYLLPDQGKETLLLECARVLRPGGKLVLKALVTTPRWKFKYIRFQEYIMVNMCHITKGSTINIVSSDKLACMIQRAGFSQPEIIPMDRGYPYPHKCFVSLRH